MHIVSHCIELYIIFIMKIAHTRYTQIISVAVQSCVTRSRASSAASVNMMAISSLAASATLPAMPSGNAYHTCPARYRANSAIGVARGCSGCTCTPHL